MAVLLWRFLINSFLVVTLGSYRAMSLIANFTLNALNVPTNTLVYAQYTRLLPFVTAYAAAYAAWVASLGTEEGSTLAVTNGYDLLGNTWIVTWDNTIQLVYNTKSTVYKTVLKNRRKPFQRGSQGDKLIALKAFAVLLTGVSGLSAVLADVNAKIAILQALVDGHATNKSSVKIASTAVETARVTVGQQLYGVLGQLMDIFNATPGSIGAFFNLTAIRRLEQSMWNRAIKAATTAYIFTRTLLATDQLKLVNLNLTILRFAFLATKDGVITTVYVEVPPLSSVIVDRSTMGSMTNTFCVVQNMDATTKGNYMIVLV
jgi:hypothetical protein